MSIQFEISRKRNFYRFTDNHLNAIQVVKQTRNEWTEGWTAESIDPSPFDAIFDVQLKRSVFMDVGRGSIVISEGAIFIGCKFFDRTKKLIWLNKQAEWGLRMSMIILKKNLTVFSVDYCSLCIDCSSGGSCFTHTFSRFIPQQTFSLPFLLFGRSFYYV